MSGGRLRVLVLSRSYPNTVFPVLGLWTEHPTRLLAERHDVRVISPVPWCPPLPGVGPLRQYTRFRRVPRREVREGVEVVRPRMLVGPGLSLYATESHAYHRAVAREVERLRRTFPFDLVHAHFVYPDGAVAHRLSRRYGVPFVISEHAPWTGWLDKRGVARAALPAAAAASGILAVSTSVVKSIRAYAGEEARTRVVPIGVDPTRFHPGHEPRTADQILFVGLVKYIKGIDVLLRAMQRIVRAGLPGRLVLAGGSFYRNTRLQEERLHELAAELQLGDRVSFLGAVPPDEVARLMATSAVVVLPSRAESFGAVLVEALACGTPVVATRCGGPEDIVTDAVGRLVPIDDDEALAAALSEVLEHRDRYEPAVLRDYALERFEWGRVVDLIDDAYRSAVC